MENLGPKKLFADLNEEMNDQEKDENPDVDAQVIKRQEKTFEELLESQLKRNPTPIRGSEANTADLVVNLEETVTDDQAATENQTDMKTPIKTDGT